MDSLRTSVAASSSLLAAIVARREEESRAATDVLSLVADYAATHRVASPADAAVEDTGIRGDQRLPSLAKEPRWWLSSLWSSSARR